LIPNLAHRRTPELRVSSIAVFPALPNSCGFDGGLPPAACIIVWNDS
jgi:hypothetical protein